MDWVRIANIALTELGDDLIMTLDDGNDRARLVKARHEDVRDATLRDHPWNCAKRRVRLAADAAPPLFGWSYAYTWPTDPYCLRPLTVGDGKTLFALEGRKILTDAAAPLNLVFIARVTDPAVFDALLVQAMAARLAATIAYRLTQSRTKEADMWTLYEKRLREARSTDAAEEPPPEQEDGDWLGAR